MKQEKLTLIPPETQYIATKHVLKVPIADTHFSSPWDLRVYAESLLERKIGDEVQLTSMKVKKPGLINKRVAKLFGRVPNARLYVTIKF